MRSVVLSESETILRRRVPMTLTWIRLLGSPLLPLMALFDQPYVLTGWAVCLVITEWLDGLLARMLRVASAAGARLDTIADIAFYLGLILASVALIPQTLVEELLWVGVAIASYACSWLASWWRFGCFPSYHTWMAKFAWFLIAPGIILLVFGTTPAMLRLALGFVVLTNIEAVCITFLLRQPRVDVPSWWHAWQLRGAAD